MGELRKSFIAGKGTRKYNLWEAGGHDCVHSSLWASLWGFVKKNALTPIKSQLPSFYEKPRKIARQIRFRPNKKYVFPVTDNPPIIGSVGKQFFSTEIRFWLKKKKKKKSGFGKKKYNTIACQNWTWGFGRKKIGIGISQSRVVKIERKNWKQFFQVFSKMTVWVRAKHSKLSSLYGGAGGCGVSKKSHLIVMTVITEQNTRTFCFLTLSLLSVKPAGTGGHFAHPNHWWTFLRIPYPYSVHQVEQPFWTPNLALNLALNCLDHVKEGLSFQTIYKLSGLNMGIWKAPIFCIFGIKTAVFLGKSLEFRPQNLL